MIVITMEVRRAEISVQALMRHQNQRRINTRPIPAPMAKMNSQALLTLCILIATKAEQIIRITVMMRLTKT